MRHTTSSRRSHEAARGFPGLLVVVLAVLAAAVAGPRDLAAQTVTGRVVEIETREPLQLVVIEAFGPDGEPLGGTFTDAGGRFTLRLTHALPLFRLDARAFTYRAVSLDSLSVAEGAVVAVEDIALERVPITLDAINVEADRPWVSRGAEWVRQGQLLGSGTFFAGAVIRLDKPTSLTQYIAERTGLLVTYNLGWEPFLRSLDAGDPCVRVQLNRWPLQGTQFTNMDRIPMETIAAIEVYETNNEVPPALKWDAGRCALVNIWTWDSY